MIDFDLNHLTKLWTDRDGAECASKKSTKRRVELEKDSCWCQLNQLLD